MYYVNIVGMCLVWVAGYTQAVDLAEYYENLGYTVTIG